MTKHGRTWSDHKITLLLNVWSERSIQAQLLGAVQNRKIVEELWKAGFVCTYKQCREKVKKKKKDTKTSTGCGGVVLALNLMNNIVEQCLTPRPHL